LIYIQEARQSLCLHAAEKDGPAHIDAELEPSYEELMASDSFRVTFNDPEGTSTTVLSNGAHLACLRQMGYEVLNSPNLIKLARMPA
jgi:hypothetical protein